MALDFDRKKLSFDPKYIDNKEVTASRDDAQSLDDSITIAEKMIKHLDMVQEFRDRIEATDYLIDNAEKLSGNLKYSVNDESIQRAVIAMGGDGSFVDFNIFKTAVKTLIQAYEEIALIELTGARDD